MSITPPKDHSPSGLPESPIRPPKNVIAATPDVEWPEIEDGCRLLAAMNEDGEAYDTIRSGLITDLETRFSPAKAEQVLNDLLTKFRKPG